MTTSTDVHCSDIASGGVQFRAVQVHSMLTSNHAHALYEETKAMHGSKLAT